MDEDDNKYSTCQGCRDGVLNQLGHMDEGGCLYLNLEEYDSYETIDDSESEYKQNWFLFLLI